MQGRLSTGACEVDGRSGEAGEWNCADEGDAAEGDGISGEHGKESSFVAAGTARATVSVSVCVCVC